MKVVVSPQLTMEQERKDELQKAKYRREEAKAMQKQERKEFSKMKARLFAEEQKAEEQAKNMRFQQKVSHNQFYRK